MWWYLSRSSGIVALVLAVVALLWGLRFSGRAMGRARANWWLDLHTYLGNLALVFTGVHVLAVLLDPDAGLGLIDVLVPGAAPVLTWPIGWGVIGLYLMLLTVVPSWNRIRSRLPRPVWHTVHLVALPMVILASVHGYEAGTDAPEGWYQLLMVTLVAVAVYPAGLRLFGVLAKRGATRASLAPAGPPPPPPVSSSAARSGAPLPPPSRGRAG